MLIKSLHRLNSNLHIFANCLSSSSCSLYLWWTFFINLLVNFYIVVWVSLGGSCLILQIGQVPVRVVSHLSMHSVWKMWRQRIVRIDYPSSNSHMQIMHCRSCSPAFYSWDDRTYLLVGNSSRSFFFSGLAFELLSSFSSSKNSFCYTTFMRFLCSIYFWWIVCAIAWSGRSSFCILLPQTLQVTKFGS